MRYFIISLFLFFVSVSCVEGRPKYITHLTDDGMVYFIFPQKLPAQKGSSSSKHPIKYDLSHLVSNDTVYYNCTVVLPTSYKIDTIWLNTSGTSREIAPEILFIEEKKGQLKYRISIQLTYQELKEMYASDSPYSLDFGNGMIFSYNVRKWAKHKQEMTKIYRIIEINKKRYEKKQN